MGHTTDVQDVQATNRATIAAILIALASFLMSAFVNYAHDDKAISNRVTAVETQQKNDGDSIHRVESKVDKLLDWALGK